MSEIYTSLPEGCIRLLTIHPRQDTELVTSTLRVAKLDNDFPLHYEALSYVWGPPEPKFPILLNGHSHLIQLNLLNFLVHQNPHHSLWIDALCINQEDTRERSRQVRMMGDIYRKADRVLLWLGLALDEQLAASMAKIEPAHLGNFSSNTQLQDALDRLPYWDRLWNLQEFLLARKILFIYGNSRVAFADLDCVSAGNQVVPQVKYGKISNMWSLIRQRTNPNPIGLKELLELTQQRQCKEIHDRVYSLLHLASEKEAFNINVDYGQNRAVLFAAVMHTVCLDSHSTMKFAMFLKGLLQVNALSPYYTNVVEDRPHVALRISLGPEPPLRVLLQNFTRVEYARKFDLRAKRDRSTKEWFISKPVTGKFLVLDQSVHRNGLFSFLVEHAGLEKDFIHRLVHAVQLGPQAFAPLFETGSWDRQWYHPQKQPRHISDEPTCYLILFPYHNGYACEFKIVSGDITRGDAIMGLDDCDLRTKFFAREGTLGERERKSTLTACDMYSMILVGVGDMFAKDLHIQSGTESANDLVKTFAIDLDAYDILSLIDWPEGGERPLNIRVYRTQRTVQGIPSTTITGGSTKPFSGT